MKSHHSFYRKFISYNFTIFKEEEKDNIVLQCLYRLLKRETKKYNIRQLFYRNFSININFYIKNSSFYMLYII